MSETEEKMELSIEDYQEHARAYLTEKDYTVGHICGSGKSGFVFEAERPDGETVGIKVVPMATREKSKVLREYECWKIIKSPHVIELYDFFHSDLCWFFEMEYARGGTLLKFIQDNDVLTEKRASKMILQVAIGVLALHVQSICHRDLKLENIVLTEDGTCKLLDFGFAEKCTPGVKMTYFCGSLRYLAPEIASGNPYSGLQVDCWSLGVIAYSVLTRHFPFNGSTRESTIRRICEGKIPTGLLQNSNRSTEALQFIKRLLRVESNLRSTIQEALSHPWFTSRVAIGGAQARVPTGVKRSGATPKSKVDQAKRNLREKMKDGNVKAIREAEQQLEKALEEMRKSGGAEPRQAAVQKPRGRKGRRQALLNMTFHAKTV